MKTSAIVCAALAGTFGFGSLASAQSINDPMGITRLQNRRDDGRDQRQQARRDQPQEARRDQRQDNNQRQGWRDHQQQRSYQQPQYGYQQRSYQQPHYGYEQPRYQQPRYVYQQPSYRAHRFSRGSYLPHQYRQHPYYVSNWQAYPGLYAPAYGQQWINVDGEFLLVALASGLIANALMY
jgi:Ni/Co efflux regulator RcnB